MSKQEILKAIDEIETAMFYEEMKNFINWNWYNQQRKKLNELQAKLK